MSNRTYSSVPTDLRGTANFPYIWDAGLVQTGGNQPITGNWRIFTTADVANNTINLTGASFSIQSVAVTGGSINVAGGSLALTNPILAISGIVSAPNGFIGIDTGVRAVQVANSAPMPFSGTVQGGNTIPLNVTGIILTQVTGNIGGTVQVNSVAITGAPVVTLTGNQSVSIVGTPSVTIPFSSPVFVTGNFGSASSSSSIALTGFSPTLPPLPVSGNFVSTPGNTAITGFDSKIAPLAVSGSFTSTPGNTAITGFNSTIPPLAISGIVTNAAGFIGIDTGIRAVNIVSSINQFVVNSGGYTAITGSVAVTNAAGFIGIDTGIRAVNLTNTSPIPISGVVNTSVTVGNVSVTGGQIYAIDTLGNALLSGISGQLSANLNGVAPVSGFVQISYTNPVFVTGSFSSTVTNPLGVTGTAYDRNPILSGLGTYNFLPIGGRVANPSGAGALTGYATGAFAMLNLSPQGALFVSQGVLDRNYDQVTIFPASSGILTTAIVSGAAPGPLSAGLALPNNPNRRSWYLKNLSTGVLLVKMGNTAPTTGNANLFLAGGSGLNDGLGQAWNDDMGRWTGPVFVSGLNPTLSTLYTAWEL